MMLLPALPPMFRSKAVLFRGQNMGSKWVIQCLAKDKQVQVQKLSSSLTEFLLANEWT